MHRFFVFIAALTILSVTGCGDAPPADAIPSTPSPPIETKSNRQNDSVESVNAQFMRRLNQRDMDGAERALLDGVNRFPKAMILRRRLAQWFAAQGRGYEAAEQLRPLLHSRQIQWFELLLLVEVDSPTRLVNFGELIEPTRDSLFEMRDARLLLSEKNDAAGALAIMDRLSDRFPKSPALAAFRGRLIAMIAPERFVSWFETRPDATDQMPEHWLALGLWFDQRGKHAEAATALTRCIEMNPTNRDAVRVLVRTLSALDQPDKALQTQEHLATLDQIFRRASSADATTATWIAGQLQSLVRPWESLGWYEQSFRMNGTLAARQTWLNERANAIGVWESDQSPEQIASLRMRTTLKMDAVNLPVDSLAQKVVIGSEEIAAKSNPSARVNSIRFRECAETVGLRSMFVSDYPLDRVDFYLHQANGGGLAALDFDLDGHSDLYVVQTGGVPQVADSSQPNELHRQTDGAFGDVATQAGVDDRRFGQGVAAADINQDGWMDLLIANIGVNSVYINQGDGTYRRDDAMLADNLFRWTSDVLVGDLNRDGLPDVVEVNYLDDDRAFQVKCVDREIHCVPQRFTAAADRFLVADPSGRFSNDDNVVPGGSKPNYGFTGIVADFDSDLGNEVMIANDGDINHFWASPPGSDSSTKQEIASLVGVGVGASGYAQACMGVTAADFDRNGRLDLAVTNFHGEAMNLFLQKRPRLFSDEATSMKLTENSTQQLGFGVQAADFDNDGWEDLAVLNGHLYDATYAGIDFRMRPQLFHGGATRFETITMSEGYFSVPQLGRTLVRWDFDRDGQMDLAANHLDQPLAVLKNENQTGQWLQIELIGTRCEREAIGARVVVTTDQGVATQWCLGGDGYMSTNEPVLHFGLAAAQRIESVVVHWPMGNTETIGPMELNQRALVVESQNDVWNQRRE